MKKVLSILAVASATIVSAFAEKSENLVKMEDWEKDIMSTEINNDFIQFSFGSNANWDNDSETVTLIIDISKEVLEYDSIFVSTDYQIVWSGNRTGNAFAQFELLDEENNVLESQTMLNWTGNNFQMETPENINTKIKIPENTHYAKMTLKGKDQLRWSGAYGPKFSNIQIIAFSNKILTYVKNIQTEKENQVFKKFENGQIVIIRGDKKFDIFGREIK